MFVHQGEPLKRGVLVTLPYALIDAVRTEGLNEILARSEFDPVHRGSLFKCAFGCAAFDLEGDAVHDETEHGYEPFCL